MSRDTYQNNNYRRNNYKKDNRNSRTETKVSSIFHNLNKYDDAKPTSNRPDNRKFDNKKPHNNIKKNKSNFNGFCNRIKFKHVDPCGYTKQALKDYLYGIDPFGTCEPSHELIRKFRSKLFDNYHLYEIRISNENHFNTGYSFLHVGWMAASKEPGTESVNISVWFTKDILDTVPENIRNIIYFKSIGLANQLFLNFGKYSRILLSADQYNAQKKYLKVWSIDNRPNIFTSVFGDVVEGDKNNIVLINSTIGATIKIGLGLDTYFIDRVLKVHNVVLKVLPFTGVALYRESADPRRKHAPENLIGTINKCNKKGEITYSCSLSDADIVTTIINEGVDYETSKHHKIYSKPTSITRIADDSL